MTLYINNIVYFTGFITCLLLQPSQGRGALCLAWAAISAGIITAFSLAYKVQCNVIKRYSGCSNPVYRKSNRR